MIVTTNWLAKLKTQAQGRMTMNAILRTATCCSLLALAACLSSKETEYSRYFSAWSQVDRGPEAATSSASDAPSLRLRHLGSAGHLGDRMSWRRDGNEFGYYELQRWTEAPEAFVARALADHLFARPDVRRSESAGADALDVTVIAFEEVIGPEHVLEIALQVELVVDRETRFDNVFIRRVPLEKSKPLMLAHAAENALRAIATEIGEAVAVELRR